MNNDHKILQGLNYISIIFAPVLFPLIVWLATAKGSKTQETAKNALWLHILPVILGLVAAIITGSTGLLTNNAGATSWVALILIAFVWLVDVVLVIYNLYKGIKLMFS